MLGSQRQTPQRLPSTGLGRVSHRAQPVVQLAVRHRLRPARSYPGMSSSPFGPALGATPPGPARQRRLTLRSTRPPTAGRSCPRRARAAIVPPAPRPASRGRRVTSNVRHRDEGRADLHQSQRLSARAEQQRGGYAASRRAVRKVTAMSSASSQCSGKVSAGCPSFGGQRTSVACRYGWATGSWHLSASEPSES